MEPRSSPPPGAEIDCQLRMLHPEGHYEVIECTARNLLDDPRVGAVLVTTRNVSRRHAHDRLLADANAALEAIAAGKPLYEVAGLVRSLLVHQDSDYEHLSDDAEELFAALEGDETPGGAQARWILTLAMSSHRVTEELRERAILDSLTGLVNRVGFTEAIRDHLATADGPAAVLLFDLDRFKQVNDAYGHSVGDAVLVLGGRRPAPHGARPATSPPASVATSSPCCAASSRATTPRWPPDGSGSAWPSPSPRRPGRWAPGCGPSPPSASRSTGPTA